jgi:hypothetical protein
MVSIASWSTVSGETARILVAFFGFLTGDEPKVRISNARGLTSSRDTRLAARVGGSTAPRTAR